MTAPVRTFRRGGGPALDDYLRHWLGSLPGMFRADTEAQCLERALSFFLPHVPDSMFESVTVDAFAAALRRMGFQVEQRKVHGGHRDAHTFVLALPEPPRSH